MDLPNASPSPPDDALEHLWNAAHEFLRAMRSLVDAADEFVEHQRSAADAPNAAPKSRVRRVDIDGDDHHDDDPRGDAR